MNFEIIKINENNLKYLFQLYNCIGNFIEKTKSKENINIIYKAIYNELINDDFIVMLVLNKNMQGIGYITAKVIKNLEVKTCFIWQAYLEKGNPGIANKVYEQLQNWAKTKSCEKIVFITKSKAMQRLLKKYKYKNEGLFMEAIL